MKHGVKSNYITIISILILFFSCNKEKNNLYSISISPNTMVGTPAENFSLQQIKMFQASNNFISLLITRMAQDTSVSNFSVAPLYLINNLLTDTALTDWQKEFLKHYNLTELTYNQRINSEKSFLKTVKEIDSSINIVSNIESVGDSLLNIFQSFEIKLMYEDSAPDDIDNIFTTFDNKKPRLDFININGEIRSYKSEKELVSELPVGNGNYMLMLIRPLDKSIKEYAEDFTEEKYFSLINSMQERRTSISFPLIDMTDSVFNLPMPQYTKEDSLIAFPKRLNIISSFKLTKANAADLNANMQTDKNSTIFQNKNSEIQRYSSPFLFIIRGKNSNLIMYIGMYLTNQ